jgi:arsenate reductase
MKEQDKKVRSVLFLCTGNSCRSQIAEALVNQYYGDHWKAFSAGTEPAGYVHDLALSVLRELGIDHPGRSKSTDEFIGQTLDLVITVCDDAQENCPLWLGTGKVVHRGFPDPAKAKGSNEEVLDVFRKTRDDLLDQLSDILLMENDYD